MADHVLVLDPDDPAPVLVDGDRPDIIRVGDVDFYLHGLYRTADPDDRARLLDITGDGLHLIFGGDPVVVYRRADVGPGLHGGRAVAGAAAAVAVP